MKKLLLIPFALLIYFLSCWIVDFNEDYITSGSLAQNYLTQVHLYYNEYFFLKEKNGPSHEEIAIKWDRLYVTIVFAGICIFRLFALLKRKSK